MSWQLGQNQAKLAPFHAHRKRLPLRLLAMEVADTQPNRIFDACRLAKSVDRRCPNPLPHGSREIRCAAKKFAEATMVVASPAILDHEDQPELWTRFLGSVLLV